jgi:hypothetical protein
MDELSLWLLARTCVLKAKILGINAHLNFAINICNFFFSIKYGSHGIKKKAK